MAGTVTFSLDDAEFQKTMAEYIKVSSKDGATAMNRSMNNLAIFGYKEANVAQQGEIDRVQSLDWWPMYVAKLMVKRKAKQLVVRMEKATKKGKTISAKMFRRLESLHYTREEARKESARIIRKRSVAISFVRFFFASMSRQVKSAVPGMSSPPSRTFKGFESSIIAATAEKPAVRVVVRYPYRGRGEKSVRKAESILQDILERAKPLAIADMRSYIASKARDAFGRAKA